MAGKDKKIVNIQFDFNPSDYVADKTNETAVKAQHHAFATYMFNRMINIDIWNGNSKRHFGTCRIPLSCLMRQA
jgi:hypothetical protein